MDLRLAPRRVRREAGGDGRTRVVDAIAAVGALRVERRGTGEGRRDQLGAPAASGGPVNAISAAAPVACEGVGISPSFSFDEAFQAAIRDAEPGPGYPDRLLTFTVQEVGARFGGIAGFRHMFVRVRCTSS